MCRSSCTHHWYLFVLFHVGHTRCVSARLTFCSRCVCVKAQDRGADSLEEAQSAWQQVLYQVFEQQHNQNKKLDFKIVLTLFFGQGGVLLFCLLSHARARGGGYLQQ